MASTSSSANKASSSAAASSSNKNNNPSTSGATTNLSVSIAQLLSISESKSKVQIAAINKTFREVVTDPKKLDEAADYLYNSLLDDVILGVFLEMHHLNTTGNLSAFDGKAEDERDSSLRIVDIPNFDIFGVPTAKKPMDCTCPNCDRPVAAARFAPHLEKCMGMGRSSRIASRRLATKDSSSSSSYRQMNVAGTDDEDDVDWSAEKKRKKAGQSSRNVSKRSSGKSF